MKNVYFPSLFTVFPTYYSQIIQTGRCQTDVDTRVGIVSSLNVADDWFAFVIGKRVIDTTNTASYNPGSKK